MKFQEWLLNEIRFKGLYRQFRKDHPHMPDFVARDIYANRHGFTMKRLVNQNKDYASTEPAATTVISRTNVADPDQTTVYDRKIQQAGFYRNPSSALPSNAPSQIFDAHNLKNVSWTRKPVILNVDPSDFTERTQEIFVYRDFGYRANDQIRNDATRTLTQRSRYPSADGTNEPVIVLQVGNKYELLEGWHRTMALLLAGCPEDQHNALKNPSVNSWTHVDFSQWREVPIRAYVGFAD